MSNLELPSLERILQFCAEAAPRPWYPSAYVQAAGIPRDRLDPRLDQLRLAGLVRLTDWEKGTGQGYALTEEGERVLHSPRDLARLRDGQVPARPAPEAPAPLGEEPMTEWDRGEAVRLALLKPGRPVVTQALLFLNLAWFLAGLGLALQRQGSLSAYLTGGGDRVVRMTLYQMGVL